MCLGVSKEDIASNCASESVMQLWKAHPQESCVRWHRVASGAAQLPKKERKDRAGVFHPEKGQLRRV